MLPLAQTECDLWMPTCADTDFTYMHCDDNYKGLVSGVNNERCVEKKNDHTGVKARSYSGCAV